MSLEYFERWYGQAVSKLKELPDGDGAFAALMVGLPLYERLIIARLKLDGSPTDEDSLKKAMAADLGIGEQEQAKFWAIFRVGFMHQAMGQAGRTSWRVSEQYSGLPEFREIDGKPTVCLNPWKFVDRVLDGFRKRPELITASESFPLAGIFPMAPSEV